MSSLICSLKNTGNYWARIEVERKKDNRIIHKTEIVNLLTYQRYYDEPKYVVSFKCLMILPGNLFHFSGTVLWNMVQIIVDLGKLFYNLLTSCRTLKDKFIEVVLDVTDDLTNIVRSVFYSFSIATVAIWGIFMPYLARETIASLEYNWNHCIGRDKVMNIANNIFDSFLHKRKSVFYLAHCFQPLGSLRSLDIIKTRFIAYC
jgi:hypothetical protein